MLNQVKTAVLLSLLTGLVLVIGQLLGGRGGLSIALFFVVVMNAGMFFFSDRLVLAMYRAQEAKKTEYQVLHKIVEELAHKASIPKPKVYVIPTPNPNAFATGRSPKHASVAVTEGILSLLTEKELRGVLAHELSHVKNRDTLVVTVAATLAGVISYLASMAQWAFIFGGGRDDEGQNPAGILVLAIVTPLLATVLQLAISRSREYLADSTGASISRDPASLASALRKIESGVKHNPLRMGSPATSSLFIINPFSGGMFLELLSTHPPTAKRIEKLQAMNV